MPLKPLEIGPYRHRVTFQTATDTPNARGGTTRTWLDAFTVWGQIEVARPYRPGTEQLDNERPVSAVTWNWYTRWNSVTSTLVEKQRFTSPAWPGKTFEIITITNVDGRNVQLAGQAVEIED